MEAAKRKTFWLVWIASAILLSLPALASSADVLHLKTRAELSAENGQFSVESSMLNPANATRYYDSFEEVASDSPVAPNSGLRNPNSIRFSQDSVRGTFSDGRSVRELTEGLRSGAIKPTDVPAVRLVERQGKLISIDNRRLQAFRDAGVDIPTRMATPQEIQQAIRQGKFSGLDQSSILVKGLP